MSTAPNVTPVNPLTLAKYRALAPQAVGWLLTQAHHTQTVTYADLGAAVAVHHRGRAMGWLLYEVARFCDDHSLPNLTAMVVNASDGTVSDGYWWPSSPQSHTPIVIRDPQIERYAIMTWVTDDLSTALTHEVIA